MNRTVRAVWARATGERGAPTRGPGRAGGHGRSALLGAARVAGWGLCLWGGAAAAAMLFEERPLALVILQGAWAEWGAGRLGIPWSDALAPSPTVGAVARRAARGAAFGALAAAALILVALATRVAAGALGPPRADGAAGILALGLIATAFAAVRDELLLRGVVLRALRGLVPSGAALLVCGAVGAAAAYGLGETLPLGLLAEALRAVALASLWARDRGAWMAWAANTSFAWTLTAIAHGGLVDVRFGADPLTTAPAVAVLAVAAAVGAVATRARR